MRILNLAFVFTALLWGPASGPSHGAATSASVRISYVSLGDGSSTGVADQIALRLPPGSRSDDLGAGSARLVDVLQVQLPRALRGQPTVASLLLLNGDDARLKTSTFAFHSDLQRLLAALQRVHAKALVATYPDPRYVPFFAARGRAFVQNTLRGRQALNAVIHAVAIRRHAVVIDIFAHTRDIWGRRVNVGADGVSLLRPGQVAVARLVLSAMRKEGDI